MIASEITIIAEIFPRFTGRDVPISEIAKATGKSERDFGIVFKDDADFILLHMSIHIVKTLQYYNEICV